jgi:uncharacterized protein Yka (UPF0111/DUF47 family)
MNEEQFKQMMDVLNKILESVQSTEDAIYDANFKEHNEKVEWNLWEIQNLAKFAVKGRNGTIDNLPDSRPSRDAERTKNISEETK